MKKLSEDKWKEARNRMEKYIDAIFWQDLGISGAENKKYVDWILDRIVRPEFDRVIGSSPQEKWCVMRMDDNGNEFVFSKDHSFDEATRIAREYEDKGHKQTYWIRRM